MAMGILSDRGGLPVGLGNSVAGSAGVGPAAKTHSLEPHGGHILTARVKNRGAPIEIFTADIDG